MRPDMVVPGAELTERDIQLANPRHHPPIQLPLQRPEQTLDASVHPWTAGVGSLMANPQPLESEDEQARREYRLVIRANETGATVLLDRIKQTSQQEDGRLVSERGEGQHPSATVIDDAKDGVKVAIDVRLAGEVNAPCSIDRNGAGHPPFPGPAQILYFNPMPPHPTGHERLAHRHAALDGMEAIERRRDPATTRIRHPRLQTNEFAPDPFRLGSAAHAGRMHHAAATGEMTWYRKPSCAPRVQRQPEAKPRTVQKPKNRHERKDMIVKHAGENTQTTYTITIAMGQALSMFAQNEQVERIAIKAIPGKANRYFLVTVSGKEFEVPLARLVGII